MYDGVLCDINYRLKACGEIQFFRAYILSKKGMMKLLGNLVINVSSSWSRCSIKKTMSEHSHDMAPHPIPCLHAFLFYAPPSYS